MRRALAGWSALAVLGALLAIAASWPLVLHLDTHFGENAAHPDVQCAIWWFPHVAESLVQGRSPFFSPDLAWPEGQDLRLLTWNVLLQVLYAPLSLAVEGPLTRVNLALLLTLVLDGLGCAWLAGRCAHTEHSGVRWAARAAGLAIGATSGFAIAEAGAGRFEQALFAPVAVALGALVAMERAPRDWRPAALGAVALAVTAGMYWFHGYFLAILFALWVWGRVLRGRADWTYAVHLGVLGLGSLVLALPLAWPVIAGLGEQPGFFGAMATERGDAVSQQLQASVSLWRGLAGGLVPSEDPSVQLPLLAVPLCLLAAVLGRGGARVVGLMGLVAACFSLGPVLLGADGPVLGGRVRLPGTLLNLLPGYERLWWPYRWQAVLVPAAAGAAGLLAGRLAARPLRLGLVALVAALCLADTGLLLRGGLGAGQAQAWPQEFTWPAGVDALAELPHEAPVLVLPLGRAAMVALAVRSGQPLDTGLGYERSSVRPAGYQQRRRTLPLWVALQQVQDLVRHGIGPPTPAPETPPSWSSEQAGGMHYVVYVPGPGDSARVSPFDALLGPPFACNEAGVVWAVPGVGTVPEGYAEAFEAVRAGGVHPCDAPRGSATPGPG